MINKRYIFDALYGVIYLPDFIWELIPSPELQRLREIRLCNINSLSLTGGANINRFEHAVGTCYLALKCYESWLLKRAINESERRVFLIAALFHDVANSAFGHSVEYVEKYRPEDSFFDILHGTKGTNFTAKRASTEPVFFGLRGTLYETLSDKFQLNDRELQQISDAIQGQGIFGPLISNGIDLDNIDNVYRLAYHIGLVKETCTPLKLASSLIVENNELLIDEKSIHLLQDWFETRKLLYNFLLLNPDEFAGKCMLTEAVEISKEREFIPFKWSDTDYELLKKLGNSSSENAVLITRLMTGNLYGCVAIFSTSEIAFYNDLVNPVMRKVIEKEIEAIIRQKYSHLRSALIALHPILDSNKTERKIKMRTTDHESVEIGYSSKRLLIGVFFKNKDLNINSLRGTLKGATSIQMDIRGYFSQKLKDPNLSQLELYDESKYFAPQAHYIGK